MVAEVLMKQGPKTSATIALSQFSMNILAFALEGFVIFCTQYM